MRRRQWLLGMGSTLTACSAVRTYPADFPRAPACRSCPYVDVHCHVFNGSDLPIAGFLTHVAPVPERLTKSLFERLHRLIDREAPSGDEESVKLDELIREGTLVRAPREVSPSVELRKLSEEWHGQAVALLREEGLRSVDSLASTLQMIVGYRHEVAARVVETYPQVDLFTPLLVDYDYFADGHPETGLMSQLDVHSKMSRLSMRGALGRAEARLHPFAPFNPMREVREVISTAGAYQPFSPGSGTSYPCTPPDVPPPEAARGALQPLRHAIERLGFVGVKLYPPVGFLPLGNAYAALHGGSDGEQLDAALTALYSYCQAEQIPVTTHAANSNGYRPGYGMLARPDGWLAVLNRFPALRLNLGHFGHLEGLREGDARGIEACEAWMRQAAHLINEFDNVYADFSNSPLAVEDDYSARFRALLGDLFERYPRARQRLMYGSDWWMNRLAPNHERFVDAVHADLSESFPDLIDDLMGRNALRFLGMIDDDGKPDENNRNRKRLQAHYGSLPQPEWLSG